MSKYNSLKFLKETKARILHTCYNCGNEINKGEVYYPESIGRVNAPSIKLRKFCKNCYEKHGEKLLAHEYNHNHPTLIGDSSKSQTLEY